MKKIICPNCGAEYAPQEIFLMNTFNNTDIIKDEKGSILTDLSFDDDEIYKCDYCNQTFHVTMNIEFNVYTKHIEEHTTKLHKPLIFLKEE